MKAGKKSIMGLKGFINKGFLTFFLIIYSFILKAQDLPKPEIEIHVEEQQSWYGNWWVWAIGLAVFIIIIVAITNRGGRRD